MSMTLYDKRGLIAARSPNGSEPMRFPNGALRRQRRRPRGISRIICHAAGQKVACAAGAFFQEIKARGYTGSFSNLERLLAKWRNPKRKAATTAPIVPRPQPLDPATGRSISPIVAAALCIKPRGLLTANQTAKVDAMKESWPEFAAMRRLAMRFRGMLKSKSVGKLGVWLKDAQKSGLYAMQRFARTLQRDIDAVRKPLPSLGAMAKQKGRSTA